MQNLVQLHHLSYIATELKSKGIPPHNADIFHLVALLTEEFTQNGGEPTCQTSEVNESIDLAP